MIRVQIDDLSKSYDGVSALDGSTLEIRPGERMVILGPSGAGKTVLARLLAGLDKPDSGDIRFDERSVLPLEPEDRKVGLVPRDEALWPHRNVADNIGYALKVRGVGRRERKERVTEALGAARIDSLGDRDPASLTTIQKKRVALARALITEPELLILDEPMSGLDIRQRSDFREELRRVQGESETTALILTTDPREAMALGDRLAVMDFGRILQVGLPGEVYNHPVDSFVAQLLGPTNLIQGQAECVDSRGDVVVRTPLGRLIGRAIDDETLVPGSPVTVVIRPEALGVGNGVPNGANRFAAIIDRMVLLGATRQVYLRGPGQWPVVALALQAPSDCLREGQNLTVSVPPEFVVVLPSRATRTEIDEPT